jgi:type I restriction enzyme, S subunit
MGVDHKPYRDQSRQDWDAVRVKIMRWCLRVKLAQNFKSFGRLLWATGERPIVEQSRKDDFWGAKEVEDGTLVGMNVLGRLLMELREELKSSQHDEMRLVRPLPIPDFALYGQPIEVISDDKASATSQAPMPVPPPLTAPPGFTERSSLFRALESHQRPTVALGRNGITADTLASLRPYSSYQRSAPTWVGAVPDHWSVLPNRALFAEVKERNRPKADLLSVTITRGVIPQTALLAGSSKKDSSKIDKSAYKCVSPGDLAYNKMRAWQGAIGVSQFGGIVSPAYIVMRLRTAQHQRRYFHYLYRIPHFAKEAERWSYGITSDMWSLRPEHFRLIYSPLPPPDEQVTIVRFIDHATHRIDKAIQAKRRLIAFLNEQRNAIINKAITRGIDGTIALKNSGVEWLGPVPQNWEVLRLGAVVQSITGFPFPSSEFSHDTSDVKLLRGINVTPSGLRWDSTVYWRRRPDDGLDRFRLQEGDIVLGMDRPIIGSGVRAARVEESDVPSLLLQRVARLRPSKRLNARFLLLLLRGRPFADYIAPIFTGISMPHLSPEQIKTFKIALPSREEQERILEYIGVSTVGQTVTINTTEREIDLLREYRTRLITDVVTGKLDVREAAAKLPYKDDAQDEPILTDEEAESDLEESTVAGAAHG